jgi:WS/DGAT/MGAT family acyltransferase
MADVDRVSADDRAYLAMDGRVPSHMAAVLVLEPEGDFDVASAVATLCARVAAIPRLRQRIVRTALGCGGPIWVDDPFFEITRHVHEVDCPPPGDDRALLDAAADIAGHRLPRDRPLWSITLVSGLTDGRTAMVVVLHHAVADGLGGLAVLAALADGAAPPSGDQAFPAPPPSPVRLAAEAARRRARAVGRISPALRQLSHAFTAAGGLRAEPAAPCSLLRRTGTHRRLVVIRADLAEVRAAAHRAGGTVNDALLCAVAGAVCRLLATRGESMEALRVAVPVAGRRAASRDKLGNQVAPLLVTVEVTGAPGRRIAAVAARVQAARALASGPPPIATLGPAFRAVAALGGYRWYMNRQRRLHTVVGNIRGPERPMRFAGADVVAVIPVAVAEAGNVAVSFEALSYAGTLTVTAIADPDAVPDLPVLADALAVEFGTFGPANPGPSGPTGGGRSALSGDDTRHGR